MTEEQILAFEERVERSFANVPYPGDDNIVYNNVAYDPECKDILGTFRSRTWRSISKEDVLRHKDSPPLFTPAAFRYYLPAYLIECAKHRLELDVAPENLASGLTPPRREAGSKWNFFWARAQLFDAEQCRVIIEYLELTVDFVQKDWAGTGTVPTSLARLKQAIEWWRARVVPA